jgi:hypothetical protein
MKRSIWLFRKDVSHELILALAVAGLAILIGLVNPAFFSCALFYDLL